MSDRPPTSMVRMTLYLSPTEDAILDRLAPLHSERGRPSRSEVVRQAIALFAAPDKPTEPRNDVTPIFSGDTSQDLWAKIGRLGWEDAGKAIYTLGCKCQELEALVRKSLARIEALEGKLSR